MRNVFCHGKVFLWFFSACFLAFSLFGGTVVPAAGQVAGAIAGSGGQVSATPISIPRPIHLEKIHQLSKMKHVDPAVKNLQIVPGSSVQDFMDNCELISVTGKELTLRLHYRIHTSRPQPIYAGAWLYDASGQSIDAGYKPVEVTDFPSGSVDVVLVLPDKPFVSDYLETFLMGSGQPGFVNGRFKMAYLWKDGVLSEPNSGAMKVGGAPGPAAMQSHQDFCRDYATTAVDQYNYARDNKLPGIVPPVWSDDLANHYSWCLNVPADQARQGTTMRQKHLDRYKYPDQSSGQKMGVPDLSGTTTVKSIDEAFIKKPVNDKKLDPGLGP